MKKRFQRIAALFLCAGMTAGMLSGCGQEEQKTLNLYTWDGMFPQEILDGCEAETGYAINFSHFDYDEDEVTLPKEFDYYFEEYMDKSKNGRAFLEKYAEFYSAPIEKYWEEIHDYVIGYEDFDEWVQRQLDEGDLTAIYVVTDDGGEEFVEFEWE